MPTQPIRIPIPQSSLIYDADARKPVREWYIYLESLGSIVNPLASLPPGRIWIGDSLSDPIAHLLSGDVTMTSAGLVTITNNAITTAKILDDAVTFAKMQEIATDSLIGRDTAGTGNPENITLNGTLSMTGAGALQRAALTGDISAPAGSNTTTLATVNANVGTFGDSTHVAQVTLNAKGLVTAASNIAIGAGTVTSVAFAATPTGIFDVSGSPITTNGTITLSLDNQNANLILAGPSTGAAATPSFRSMVAADIPNTAVTPGSYTSTNLTVDAQGRITAASNGSGAGVLLPSRFEARLTLTSGDPVPESVTAATTLYLTPYKGGHLSLYTSSVWTDYTLTEISISLSTLIKGVVYDVFLYDSSGTLTLELVVWKKVTATSSPTSGANKTINVPDTSSLSVDDFITVKDGSNSENAKISAIVANTSITVINLISSYTLPDIYGYRTRVTDLTLQDNIYVKTGATNKRYVGTIRADYNTAGQASDDYQFRNLWNYYNRIRREMHYYIPTNSWSYTLLTWRQANADTANQINCVVGVVEDGLEGRGVATASNSAAGTGGSSCVGLNRTSAPTGLVARNYPGQNGYVYSNTATVSGTAQLGNNYMALLELSTAAGTTTWYGDNGVDYFQTGINGSVMA